MMKKTLVLIGILSVAFVMGMGEASACPKGFVKCAQNSCCPAK